MESNTPSILQMMTDETFDPSTFLGSSLYCSIVKNMALGCLQQSMLDLWRFDETIISNLTKAEIVNKINSVSVRSVNFLSPHHPKLKQISANHSTG